MFSPIKIAAKIKAIEDAKKITLHDNSVDECIKIYEHFKSLETSDGRNISYARKGQTAAEFSYTEQERAWIQNEMYMCACSFPYWFFRYFFIKTKEGDIRRPEVLAAQLIFIAILAAMDLAGLPMLLLILKGRQLGLSTVIEAVILWISIFVSNSHCVVASAEEEKSEQMSEMVWLGLEKLPMWMQPVLTRDNRQVGPEFGLIHSDILLQHGSQSKGISRGDTPIAAHLSEVAWYPDPINTIESSLIRAMHENSRTFLALETTARKKDDWFHRTWVKNRKGEETGYNRFTCLFLPWYVGRDKYPTADWLRNHPIPPKWNPLKETLKQAADARLYVATTALLKKHMPEDWEMPIEQMWYWEFNYVEAKEGGDETYKSFLAELAADERSCFQSKKLSVFSQAELDKLEADKSDKFTVYGMAGDGIDHKYALAEFQSHQRRRIDIAYPTIEGQVLHWKLIPLKEIPRDEKLKYYLKVWEEPKPGYKYAIGIDISSGIGQNATVYFVNRIGRTAEEPDLQVAVLNSPWIASPETPGFALMLGAWYGTHMSPVKEAMIAPEVQKAVGDFISFQLAKVGYSNFYYMERFDLRQHPGHRPTRRGWASVGWSQQMMKESFEHGIKNGWIEINSEDLINELSWLEAEETESGKMAYDHARDQTDDEYVAGGIAYFVSHGQQTIMERIKGNLKPVKKATKESPLQVNESGLSLLARQFQKEDLAEFPAAEEFNVRVRNVY
jgi:hypothetical protein